MTLSALKCEHCGQVKPDVKERIDPYDEEINNREEGY
jgi:hypothetical protein